MAGKQGGDLLGMLQKSARNGCAAFPLCSTIIVIVVLIGAHHSYQQHTALVLRA